MLIKTVWVSCLTQHGSFHVNSILMFPSHMTGRFSSHEDFNYLKKTYFDLLIGYASYCPLWPFMPMLYDM